MKSIYNNFLDKLKLYQPYEMEASKKIESKFNVNILNFCNKYEFDFIDSNLIKYKVKCDKVSEITNNFFVEFKGYGKASGITTKANYYIFYNAKGNFYLISVAKLKRTIKEIENIKVIPTKDKQTYGYLIKTDTIIKCSIIL
jgi:hypothetical protein